MEGEEHNLCKALKEWLADERNAGIKEGIKESEKTGARKGEIRFASLTSVLLTLIVINLATHFLATDIPVWFSFCPDAIPSPHVPLL